MAAGLSARPGVYSDSGLLIPWKLAEPVPDTTTGLAPSVTCWNSMPNRVRWVQEFSTPGERHCVGSGVLRLGYQAADPPAQARAAGWGPEHEMLAGPLAFRFRG